MVTSDGKVEIITEKKTITAQPPSDVTKDSPFPSTGTGDYPVVLEIEGINIIDPGFGYDPNDEVVVGNGAELKIKTDALGSVIGVDVLNGGSGFNEDPDLYIKSDKGYNAKIMPIFKPIRLEDLIEAPVGVIQVVDCVGKF